MVALAKRYKNDMVPVLVKEFNYENVMQVPKLTKVVINIGLGEATTNSKAVEAAEKDLLQIAGQKPVIIRAKKSIANFKLREGMPIGMKVTLRGVKMYDFVTRVIDAALPRIRDFQGVSDKGFDGMGNYSIGFKEQTHFPEIDFSKIDKPRGLEISFVTTAKTDAECKKLLELMGMPFVKRGGK
ncbi:MAG: 50S ribosomal protein L5 [Chloroflexi bacterium]|nr:50S ribosomal protein L5 [Chloroflexota bacterium]